MMITRQKLLFVCLESCTSSCYFSSYRENVQTTPKRPKKLFTVDKLHSSLHEISGQVKAWDMAIQAKPSYKSSSYPDIIKANVGDAQSMGMPPITFIRQVIACVTYPELIKSPKIPKDVRERASEMLEACNGRTIGCYSPVGGLNVIRQHCADYITQRDDGIESCPGNILIMNGATDAINSVFQLFKDDNPERTGVMIPIPQYPLYSALISEFSMCQVNYYLDEDLNWAINVEELEKSYDQAVRNGIDPKVLVIINPGNPTGQVLTRKNIEEVIDFAYRRELFIMADEVYQDNVYDPDLPFHSFKKVMVEMDEPYSSMELASFYSLSKGYTNECGLRAGYVEFFNLDQDVLQTLVTALSIKMCSTVLGQIGLDCLVKPPTLHEESYELWHKEKNMIMSGLKQRVEIFQVGINSIPGLSCNPIQGSMFAFARIDMPKNAIDYTKKNAMEPDYFYTTQLLQQTGISILPGCTFGQAPETYHFRTSILPKPSLANEMFKRLKKFHDNFIKEYK